MRSDFLDATAELSRLRHDAWLKAAMREGFRLQDESGKAQEKGRRGSCRRG